ncbi:RNA polymerase sigma factor [Panacibacter sp. DH6]|uniref:RNA polymerase sigma factor n=1 Tax=Panacibacter microcysteis TaxID=2793269 RepID=A0A931GZ88_9BACT|nr:RNA polymerase sigma factor [Panacibacter microcysteis]MBG9378072.1 RNA polymerase sigma factor [Panacibacter microcysteis]
MTKNKQTFLLLLEQHKGILIKICNAYCQAKDDKEDLSQEIVYNLWKAFANYTPDHKFSTWLYRVALNVAISYYRKEKRSLQYTPYDENLIVFSEEGYNKELEGNLLLLQQFIFELKEIDKSIMLLYLDDKSYHEIAEITGISETNVATKISRIKANLKTKFSNY